MGQTRARYEDCEDFPADAYRVKGWRGIAWQVAGWEVEPDEDTEWTSILNRTGNVVCIMVGDDRLFVFEPDDLSPLDRDEYCCVCGQIGCHHNA